MEKRCTKCKRLKNESDFEKRYKDDNGVQMYSSICVDCLNKINDEKNILKEYRVNILRKISKFV